MTPWRTVVPRLIKRILVSDDRGVRFAVLQHEHTEKLPNSERTRKMVSFQLETGEPGRFVDAHTFELASTGERFSVSRKKI